MGEKKDELNILVFSPFMSHPTDAGNKIRIYNMCKALQNMGHKIHFVYYTLQGEDPKNLKMMETEWESLHLVKKTIHFAPNENGNYVLDNLYEESIGQTVQSVCINKNIDCVLCNYVFQSKLFESVPQHIYKIIDTHDIFTERNKKLEANGVDKSFFWFSFPEEEEKKALNRANAVIAIQDEEAKYFQTLTDQEMIVVGHLEKQRFLKRNYKTINKIGFIGSKNPINKQSILSFISKFLDSPLSERMTLHIAGSICQDITVVHPAIVKIDYIAKLKDFYEEVDIIINPLLFGTGLKIKSVEALSYGVPIISTSIGFEGIESDEPAHHCKDIESMLTEIKNVLNNNKLYSIKQKSEQVFTTYKIKTWKEIERMVDMIHHYKKINDVYSKKTVKWYHTFFGKLRKKT